MLTIEGARLLRDSYRPHEHLKEKLRDTTLVAIVGATAVGKSYLMEHGSLPIVGTVTTRAPRETDDPALYTYLREDEMLRKIEQKRLLQYEVFGQHLYGSEVGDYELDRPNVADIAFDAVDGLPGTGYKQVKAISVITDGPQWNSQLMLRLNGMRIDMVMSRLAEARHSLRWTRAQFLGGRAASHLVVINTPQTVESNLEAIRRFAEDEKIAQPDPELVISRIEAMEQTIRNVQGKLAA